MKERIETKQKGVIGGRKYCDDEEIEMRIRTKGTESVSLWVQLISHHRPPRQLVQSMLSQFHRETRSGKENYKWNENYLIICKESILCVQRAWNAVLFMLLQTENCHRAGIHCKFSRNWALCQIGTNENKRKPIAFYLFSHFVFVHSFHSGENLTSIQLSKGFNRIRSLWISQQVMYDGRMSTCREC